MLPDEALQAAAAALFRQDSVLCVCHHDEDSGYTAYIMLSNGAVAEIQLNEAR